MAFLKYRGGVIPTVAWTSQPTNGQTLGNDDIDKNFYTLNAQKLETSGGTISNDLIINGNLTVNGTSTTINSTVISVDDKNIELGSVAAPTNVTADGGGITLKGATDKTFNWIDATDSWTSSEHIAVAAGKTLRVSGSTSGVAIITTAAVAGTPTITLPATTGTLALTSQLPTVNDASLTLTIGPAGATNTTVTIGTGTGFTANDVTNTTYDIKVGPALTNLATTMATAGAGFIKRGATADTYTIDTSTYSLSNHGHFIGTTAVQSTSIAQTMTGILSTTYAGSTSGTTLLIPAAAAGTTTITMPAATGTMALTSNIGDGAISVLAGGGLSGGGQAGTANQSGASSVTLSHADTSTATNLAASARTYVTALTFDTYGHVTAYSTGTETVVDTNTWNANALNVAGYVAAPSGATANLVWKTDASGNPGWRADADTNTTYTASTGLTLTGTAFSVNYGATATTACVGNDARLSDARVASDVYAWAKAASKPAYTAAEVGLGNVNNTADSAKSVNYATTAGSAPANGGTSAACSGNAATVTNGVYTVGNQTIAGNKTFTDMLVRTMAGADGTQRVGALIVNKANGTIRYQFGIDSNDSPVLWTYDTAGGYTGVIYFAGGSVTASGNVTAYSDARLKTDLEVIPNAIEKVQQLTGYTYTRTDSGERQTGIIAQDLIKVLPEAVNDSGEYMSVAYGNIVGLLVEAIKELRAEVAELKGMK